jgi:NADH-quinone oxidoreductase subunit L
MGGLRKEMPITYVTFLVGFLAIAGIPGLAGFFSKDEILWKAYAGPGGAPWLWAMGVIGAGLTAFYMARLVILTFFGERRGHDAHGHHHHAHESPPSMTVPLVVLAGLSVVGGYAGLPLHLAWGNAFEHFLAPVLTGQQALGHGHESVAMELLLMGVSVGVALAGIAVAYVFYVASPGLPDRLAQRAAGLYDLVLNKYYVDELYELLFVRPTVALSNALWRVVDVGVIDGLVNGTAAGVGATAEVWRRWQTGNVQHYALSFLAGVLAVVGYFVWR